MRQLQRLLQKADRLHPFSQKAILFGGGTMLCLYIVALFAYLLAPGSGNYLAVMALHRGALEAAPACLAAAFSAAIICDIVFRTYRSGDDGTGS